MQTPGEISLIKHCVDFLSKYPSTGNYAHLLNVGAARSTVIEEELVRQGLNFICDRTDIEACEVDKPYVGKCFQVSVEEMKPLESEEYDLVFANYVLEHVGNIERALEEIWRVLKSNGLFVLSTPNPAAPEFLISKYTPLWFHQIMRGKQEEEGHRAYETVYAYPTITSLVKIAQQAGFSLEKADYYSFTYGYLHRFPVLKTMSTWYDNVINKSRQQRLQGNVCLVFRKQ